MNIQFYPEELNYCNAMLHPLAPKCGSFLDAFLHACIAADGENYELLRPILLVIRLKYPANDERLRMEEHDSGQDRR